MTNQNRISKLMSSDSKSLEGAPEKIGGLFEVISRLEGAPEKIGGLFELNTTISLEGAPSDIGFAKKFNKI
jgi:hypothetical protein